MGKIVWARSRATRYVLAIVSCVAVVAAVLVIRTLLIERDDLQFKAAVADADRVIDNASEDHVSVLKAAAAFADANPGFDQRQFHDLYERLGGPDVIPGFSSLGYAVRVDVAHPEKLYARAAKSGLSGYRIRGNVTNGDATVILYLEPSTERRRSFLGYQVDREPMRRTAVREAIRTGMATATGRVRLLQDSDHDVPALVIYLPLYEGGGIPLTLQERETKNTGVVYVPLRPNKVFDPQFGVELGRQLDIRIYDVTDASKKVLLYENLSAKRPHHSSRFHATNQEFLGRQWLVEYRSSASFDASSSEGLLHWLVTFAGLALALLVVLGGLNSHRQRLIEKFTEETEIRNIQQKLLLEASAVLAVCTDRETMMAEIVALMTATFSDYASIEMRLFGVEGIGFKEAWSVQCSEDKKVALEFPSVEADEACVVRWNDLNGLIVPLGLHSVEYGTLRMVRVDAGASFQASELELARELGYRISLAIENIGLMESIKNETKVLQSLQSIGMALSAELDPKKLVQLLTDYATDLVGARFGAFFAVESDELSLYAFCGGDRESLQGVPNMKVAGIFETSVVQQRTVSLTDARDEQEFVLAFPAEHLEIVSYLGVPVVSRSGNTAGLLLFGHSLPGVFGDRERSIAESIASQAAVALDNARLFTQNREEIDERRLAEERMLQLNEDLERRVTERTNDLTAANQELEAFCYSVSHDLRAPLRSVDGFSKALEEDYGDKLDAEGLSFIARVRAAAKRMDELITVLLNLSRLTRAEVKPVEVDVSETARQVVADMPGIGAKVEIQPGMKMMADAKMVRILLDNLIGNAVKFSAYADQPKIEVGQLADGTYFVRDNGVGFDPRFADKLFLAFERLHSPREFAGNGIGLATVERIARRHNGKVWAESTLGQGATFFFRLGDVKGEK